MTDYDLIKFLMPAPFIAERVMLSPCELAYGYRHGWIDDTAVIALALAGYDSYGASCSAYEGLALLLSDQLDQVRDLVNALCGQPEHAASVWVFLVLAWVLEHEESYNDPLGTVEAIYADFDYPDEIEELIRYTSHPNLLGGVPAIHQRWRAYVENKTREYRSRVVVDCHRDQLSD